MTYRPPTVTKESLKGKATIKKGRIKGDVVYGVIFVDKPAVTYTVKEDDAPKYVEPGEFYVKLGQDKSSIESTSPIFGTFKVKVEKFPSKQGEEPAPFIVENKKFNNSSEKFTVQLRIISKQYKGMPVMLFLPYYWFTEAQEEVKGETVSVLGLLIPKKDSVPFKMLRNFLSVSGAWNYGPIPWSDNVLPNLQKRILKAGVEFSVTMENGFVDQISPIMQDWGDKDEPTEELEEFSENEVPFGEPNEAAEFVEDDASDDDEKPQWDNVTD